MVNKANKNERELLHSSLEADNSAGLCRCKILSFWLQIYIHKQIIVNYRTLKKKKRKKAFVDFFHFNQSSDLVVYFVFVFMETRPRVVCFEIKWQGHNR